MWWHHLGLRLTFGTAILLLLAMLLVDGVVSTLWYGAGQRAVRPRLERVLEHALPLVTSRQGRPALEGQLASLAAASGTCVLLFSGQEMLFSTCSSQEAFFDPDQRGRPLLWGYVRPLYAEREAHLQGGGIATLRAVDMEAPVAHTVLAVQPYILLYIGINLLTLSAIAFFRFTRQVQRPLQALISATDRVPDQGLRFSSEYPRLSELHQLSFSLNRMLRRLERDRAALQTAAGELAAKNEQLLANQQEMIRTEKLAATGRLAAGLAHEIGNPLGVVQGYLELLQMEGTDLGERREYCAKALQETRRMHTLITNLLQTVRNSPVASERIDMNRLLADVVDMLRPQALFRDIDLRLVLEADNALVVADEAGMRQVLLNAFLNAADAIQATGAGQGRIVARTRQQEKGGHPWLDICISDSGCGLAPEHAAQIFDPFFTTKEAGKGTGLGLSVSLALVESMGGSMRAANGEEGGMALHIELPQASPAAIGRLHRERGQRK